MIVNGGCIRILEVTIVAYFIALSWHSRGETEENIEKLIRDNR